MDDQAVLPSDPEIRANIEEGNAQANIEDQKTAQAYWSPAWAKVQEIFERRLEAYRLNGAIAHQDEPAEEFKIRMLTDAHVASVIEEIIDEVQRAVESVESAKRTGA